MDPLAFGCSAGFGGELTTLRVSAKAEPGSIPFWLWPNLLSLDAPLVAVTWQWLLARSLHLQFSMRSALALGVCVWAIYVVDRVMDGPGAETSRHLFAARCRGPLLAVVFAVLGLAALLLLPGLPAFVLIRGLGLAACCGIYILATQGVLGAQGRLSRPLEKGFAMSLCYAAGIVLPFWNWPAFLCIAITAAFNTQLINLWEEGCRAGWVLRCMLAGAGILFAGMGERFGLGLGIGCWLMLAVDAAGGWLSLDAVRCLFDWALVLGAWLAIAAG